VLDEISLRSRQVVLRLGLPAAPGAEAGDAAPTCPEGAKLVTHEGEAMCAWETDLQDPVPSPGDEDAQGNLL